MVSRYTAIFIALLLGTLPPAPTQAAGTVYANSREVACKSGSGQAIAAIPDVCFSPPKTPSAPPLVPIPYPNMGMDADTDKGTKGKVKNSKYTKDTGTSKTADTSDVPANRGKTQFSTFEFDVKNEGNNCVRQIRPITPYHPSRKIADPLPLEQTAEGAPSVDCNGTPHQVTLIPVPKPTFTYVDPPPFEGFVVPYRSGRIPTPEESAAYRANYEAIDKQDLEDTRAADEQYQIERAELMANTEHLRAPVDAKIDAYKAENPEYAGYPVVSDWMPIDQEGRFEGELKVYYGTPRARIWVQRFDSEGNAIGRPKMTPQGRVKNVVDYYSKGGYEPRIEERFDIYGNRYWAKVTFSGKRGYWMFNEEGKGYLGEIFDPKTGKQIAVLDEEDNMPVLADHGAPLVERKFVQLAQTNCAIPCQAVTDVHNSIASEMNLIIREMNMLAGKHTDANEEALKTEAGYREVLLAGNTNEPTAGPVAAEPLSRSAAAARERYESLNEVLSGFYPKLAEARQNLELCQCPGMTPSPLLQQARGIDAYIERTFLGDHNYGVPDRQIGLHILDGKLDPKNCGISTMCSLLAYEASNTGTDFALDDDYELDFDLDCLTFRVNRNVGPITLFTIAPNAGCDLPDTGGKLESAKSRYSLATLRPHKDQWGLQRILGKSGSGVPVPSTRSRPTVVAVIDSGVDLQHPSLYGRIWSNPGEIPGNAVDDDGNGLVDDINGWNFVTDSNDVRDTNGHGTFVAGLIAAQGIDGDTVGVDPGAQVMALKVTNFAGVGNSIDIAAAVIYAVDMGARVINISLGGEEFSPAEQAGIDYALDKGVLVVVAAGNHGGDATKFWPAGIPDVLTVAATGRNDKRANYSNWGSALDIAAPGTDIISLRARYTDPMLFGEGDYQSGSNVVGASGRLYRATGTSFAAPLVSGTASRLLTGKPSLEADELKRILLNSARDIETPGPDILSGYGLLDASAALSADPAFYIESRISSVKVAKRDGTTYVQVIGTADANDYRGATLRFGAGESPKNWQQAHSALEKPVRNATLGEIKAQALASEARWTLQLEVQHANGQKRLANFDLKLR